VTGGQQIPDIQIGEIVVVGNDKYNKGNDEDNLKDVLIVVE